ncbi:hypothetical protein BOTBODRAFT_101826 [Botryobasidium botryosum FD-172 SS1]|uniref:DNA mismatch repair proteins mutS family domain-containing protein n=1 Tax=Botryobasidium botryosum (strain FD-172 SS1) TaxID=930990 RepID=A0A067MVE6_BOTB1|nr:hypothetical protein BOTBODRAFT_101826 [Botryobasidium botryosum FD-172 SS1]
MYHGKLVFEVLLNPPIVEASAAEEKEECDVEAEIPRTQLAREIHENRMRFPHCILLTRVGNFYESYFEQATEVARRLSIKLTTRSWGGKRVAMCGFPLHHLDRHIKVLVQEQKQFVAMCEEFKVEEGHFQRRVARIITPGTLIDESFINHYENNYIAAITPDSGSPGLVGVAWTDVSTGELFTQSTDVDSLQDELARIGPREIILNLDLQDKSEHPIRRAIMEEESVSTSYFSPDSTLSAAGSEAIPETPSDAVFTTGESSAIRLLTSFLQAHMLESMPKLTSLERQAPEGRLQIDSHTIKALEIKEGMREGGTTGSLISAVKRTVTSGGTRLLSRWLCSPSTSISEINARQSVVALFHSRPHLRRDIVELLKPVEDVTRIVQKFSGLRGETDDLLSIKETIRAQGQIKRRLMEEFALEKAVGGVEDADEPWKNLVDLLGNMEDLEGLARRIELAVDESALKRQEKATSEGGEEESSPSDADDLEQQSLTLTKSMTWAIRPQFSPELSTLHGQLNELLKRKELMEKDLQKTYNAPSLSLRLNPQHGLFAHIGKAKRDLALLLNDSKFMEISRSNTTRVFFYQAWAVLGSSIIEVETSIARMEKTAFESLRQEVTSLDQALQRNARITDELDVTVGFAALASDYQFVRPILNKSTSYHVVNGRHPTVEMGLLASGRTFTPNTVTLDPSSRLHIITGPNMSGKSSLLRQTALIAILAQAGSFVPADYVEMGIVDHVFSRVGAKDDLFRDRSTFMVEMLETAEILKRATDRSLVIMDEVGRGTTVTDGIAIAFATVHHLYSTNRCRALFATHFHELANMLGYSEDQNTGKTGPFKDIGFFCTDVDGSFSYTHRLRPGVNRDSHGVKVAKQGGMPRSAIEVATDALSWIRQQKGGWVGDRAELRALGERLAHKRR